jgi:hypothetical protein
MLGKGDVTRWVTLAFPPTRGLFVTFGLASIGGSFHAPVVFFKLIGVPVRLGDDMLDD